MDSINKKIALLYPDCAPIISAKISALINEFKNENKGYSYNFVDETDVMLITYGDAIYEEGKKPLSTLNEFLGKNAKDVLSAVHILPMFPYTSDDGFSVSDFYTINEKMGDWNDISKLRENFDLMFDAVINHASVKSKYFEGFLSDEGNFKDFFIKADPSKDYSKVTRPRALPLLTPFETKNGTEYVWTTFSEDQVDFNYKNPNVLLEILRVLLYYAQKGARFIRLDAIGFAWKEDNSTCMHLEKTHILVKLFRDVLECCFPGCTIITETNVPHKDNVSYFGNGFDEAALVYQFPLPPLTLYSFLSGSACELTKWAQSLEPLTNSTTYFNFLASHDGIGMRPVEDLLDEQKRKLMEDEVLARGGQISYRDMPDGSKSAYELNINYMDAIAGNEEDATKKAQKFMASQSILLSVVGMPAIYYHSLLGSRNCVEEFEKSGIKRRINREKLNVNNLNRELSEENSLRKKVFNAYKKLINVRKAYKAFAPNSKQEVLQLHNSFFSVLRGEKILAVANVSNTTISIDKCYNGIDIITGKKQVGRLTLAPYEYKWILID